MKKILLIPVLLLMTFMSEAQEQQWQQKFEQLGQILPTPNEYRTGSGAPGPKYWQQRADYVMSIELDDVKQRLDGKEKITYHNNSPETLQYLWVQLDQNVRAQDTNTLLTMESRVQDNIPASRAIALGAYDEYDGGFKIQSVKATNGADLPYVINKTMMRIDLPQGLKPMEKIEFSIDWWYNINDRAKIGGRSGYEYFPEDDNYLYAIAQFFPRMAVFDDYEGWQNKQFLGSGEFSLNFGNYEVDITVPSDHVIASTGSLMNPEEVLSGDQRKRFIEAKASYDKPVLIITEKEAIKNEKSRSKSKSTWKFKADDVRDFAFASSRKFIWDAQAVKVGDKSPLAMSFYPKEGNPLWERESTLAVKNTLEVYSKYSIDYPYPVAISVHTASIGMEYPMICFNFGRPQKDGSYSDAVKYRMIGVVIHEVGHNYYPMIINSDERQWTWMDEGLNSFVQYRVQEEKYENFPKRRGTATSMIPYMKGDKNFIRPIMTNSENVIQFGNNAYGKPAAALTILRETVMGPELFDKAFKTYAERWAFKHPKPADFFRTMEDASAMDLDWFWRGWFYSVDHVDISVDKVKWYKVKKDDAQLEGQVKSVKQGNLTAGSESSVGDFSGGPQYFNLRETPDSPFNEFRSKADDKAIMTKLENKNFYEITFKNKGGLVMPIILDFTFKDGTIQNVKLPAEIWRKNESEVTHVFRFDKEVVNIALDPRLETADVFIEDNVFPRKETPSKFDSFNKKK